MRKEDGFYALPQLMVSPLTCPISTSEKDTVGSGSRLVAPLLNGTKSWTVCRPTALLYRRLKDPKIAFVDAQTLPCWENTVSHYN